MKNIHDMTEPEIDEEILYRFNLLSEEKKCDFIAHLSELVTGREAVASVPRKGA